MSYTKPDVRFEFKFENLSPTIQDKELTTCIVGPHFFVANKKSAGVYYSGAAVSNISYPDLPNQTVDPSEKLLVDVGTDVDTGMDFSPQVYIVTPDGKIVNVSDASGVSFTNSDFSLPAGLKYNPKSGEYDPTGEPLEGQVLVSYRALEEKYGGQNIQLLSASSVNDLTDLFGDDGISIANPLGFGMYMALLRGNTTVYGVAVTNDPYSNIYGNIANPDQMYQKAFEFLETVDVNVIVLTTFNGMVHSLLKSHVETMSDPDHKMERVGIVAKEIEDTMVYYYGTGVCGALTSATVGSNWEEGKSVTIGSESYPIRYVAGNKAYIEFDGSQTSGITFTYDGTEYTDGAFDGSDNAYYSDQSFFAPGGPHAKSTDKVVYFQADTGEVSDSVSIDEIHEHVILAAFDNGTGKNKKWGLQRTITDKDELARTVKGIGGTFGTSRMVVIVPGWVSMEINNIPTDIPSFYAAAQLGGEVASTVPGNPVGVDYFIGLTNSLSKAFKSVRYFSEDQLDTIASGGISILVNSRINMPLNLRHTLTTDMSSIEKRELMMQLARDAVAFTYRDSLRNMIRKMKITEGTMGTIATYLDGAKNVLTRKGVIADITYNKIQQDADQPDKVNVEMTVVHFYPLNYISMEATVSKPTSTLSVSV